MHQMTIFETPQYEAAMALPVVQPVVMHGGKRRGLDEHVANVCTRAAERYPSKSPCDLIPMLSKRISEATDNGLASAVFWHGKWFSYSDACYMLDKLRSA